MPVLQSNNKVGDDGATGLGGGLAVNSSLQELYLVMMFVLCVSVVVILGLYTERVRMLLTFVLSFDLFYACGAGAKPHRR
jgi:hypothetical protein